MNKKISKIICLVLTSALMLSSISAIACGKKKGYNNEKDYLVISTEALDGVFNPFFSTSGADMGVVGETQIGMMTTDGVTGEIVCGQDYPTVALDFSQVQTGTEEDYISDGSYDNYYTDYYFAIKKGIKFSDGSDLTINDVLYNMYMLLDPVYTGSSTLYSVNIKGLQAYRNQDPNATSSDALSTLATTKASQKRSQILAYLKANIDNDKTQNPSTEISSYLDKIEELFKQEVSSDWSNAVNSVDSYATNGRTYLDKEHNEIKITETWQVYYINEGLISISKDTNQQSKYFGKYIVDYNDTDNTKLYPHDQEGAINAVYNYYISGDRNSKGYCENIRSIITGWGTASTFLDYLIAEQKSAYIASQTGTGLKVKNVEGIAVYQDNKIPDGKGGEKQLGNTYDILKIRIDGVDPKAVYNFSFEVTPMAYYSTAEEVAKFDGGVGHYTKQDDGTYKYDGKGNFGHPFGSTAYMETVKQNLVPMGAGAYRVTKKLGSKGEDIRKLGKADFFSNNIVYYERNDYFETVGTGLRNAKIKKLSYQVIASNQMMDAVTGKSREVMYSAPQATLENINKLAKFKHVGIALQENIGYGYIGINAKEIPNILIRRAIMYAMDTSYTLDYYGGSSYASTIYRPMSRNSWIYDKENGLIEETTPYYGGANDKDYPNLYTIQNGVAKLSDEDKLLETIRDLVREAGYTTQGADGTLINDEGDVLKYTFTVAGESEEHPAFITMKKAQEYLEQCGFSITITKDAQALSKLASGKLQVWAAAWGSTIDPDMYQVYSKNSTASSVTAWGYPTILSGVYETSYDYAEELSIIDELSEKIDEGRATLDRKVRSKIYEECLNLVMELAVELPTYQRKNLYIYNKDVIDETTLAKVTPYQGPLGRIWEVSFKK